ncbi:MAG: RNA-splicing ligase RtcB [Candidatus Omnitrophica bacterium]|nr:RNA-splicing ligase RtcB [Candidatus Omnitrophota bacterium]
MALRFTGKLEKIDACRWKIPADHRPGMKVPGIIFSDEDMLESILYDNAAAQVVNAAHLPGIVRASMAMPDIHWGYGLPIGGVVATDIADGGVVTPGGVGYDINCGVRILRSRLNKEDVESRIDRLVDALYAGVPSGVGSTGDIRAGSKDEKKILTTGARWAVERGYGWQSDLDNCEENGAIGGADPSMVSERALKRGKKQPGTLGSGNHFLEVQVVDEIYRKDLADVFGLTPGMITTMIHTGSRGLGHQICGDYAHGMVSSMRNFDIKVPDRQLSCVPVDSGPGQRYLGAMRCAANYAWANRQTITGLVRKAFEKVFGEKAEKLGMHLLYDVAHNIAKIEEHEVDGEMRKLCVHRKGATRAFPPGHPEIPRKYRDTGQPVIIPGDMGRCSYILSGTSSAEETFYSTCHGAGRRMSRTAAKKSTRGRSIENELAEKGIVVRYTGRDTLHEEVSEAYKDVSRVVDIVEKAGISLKVARLKPLAVVKG